MTQVGPNAHFDGFSGHGDKARRMLGKDRVDALHPEHHSALPYSRRHRKDLCLAPAKAPSANRTK